MMFIALLMYPWVAMCNSMGLQPRVLADDIMLSTAGKDSNHFAVWVDGYDKTTNSLRIWAPGLLLPKATPALPTAILGHG